MRREWDTENDTDRDGDKKVYMLAFFSFSLLTFYRWDGELLRIVIWISMYMYDAIGYKIS